MKVRLLFLICLMTFTAGPVSSQSSGGIRAGKKSHPVIKSKPDPHWPGSINQAAEFTIVLRAVFTSKGKVTNIRFVEVRPEKVEGLTADDLKDFINRAMEAAEKIKFIPATKDGHPVAMWMELEYRFDLKQKP